MTLDMATSAAFGHPRIQTPNLDAFARQGVRLTQCYAASAVCSPSRSAILTGRTPHRNGVYTWIAESSEVHLRTSEIALPRLLRDAGYATCHVGKWHLNGKFNDPAQPQPNDHGYDHWLATQNNAAPSHKNPSNFVRDGLPVGHAPGLLGPARGGRGDRLAQQQARLGPSLSSSPSGRTSRTCRSRPTRTSRSRTQDMPEDFRQHHGNVTQLDFAFGRLMKALDEQKLIDSTFVFFTSDNGPEGDGLKDRTRGSSRRAARRKRSMYEGGIRVPGIAPLAGPDSTRNNVRSAHHRHRPVPHGPRPLRRQAAGRPRDRRGGCAAGAASETPPHWIGRNRSTGD